MSNKIVCIIFISLLVGLWPGATLAQEGGQEYVIQADDWLSKLAEKFYGDSLVFPAIVAATNAQAVADNSYTAITNPDVVEVGQKIYLPPAEEAMALMGQAAPTNSQEVSGDLVIYTSRAETLFKPVLAAFNQAYPNVNVTLLTGNNNELAAKILEEQANPQTDLFINTDTLSMENLAAQGIFEPNNSPAVMAVPAIYRADDGNWVALTLRGRTIMYNTDLVKAEDAPTSVLELTDPKWQGQVGAADSTNGAMMAHLTALRRLIGEEQTAAFVQNLVNNDTQFFGSHTDVRKAVGAGELKLGLVNQYYYYLSKAEDAPVAIVWPDQGDGEVGLLVNSTNAGIIKGAAHADLARLFVDFMLSPQGQKIYAEQNFEWPVVPGVALAEGVAPMTDFRLAEVDLKSLWNDLSDTQAMAQAAGLP
jgi:iron(III) transport system substrate-binding protein